MKKIIALTLLLCTLVLMFSSCGDLKRFINYEKIERPENTNLEYWLLDTIDTDSLTKIEESTHYFTGSFLSSKYQAKLDGNGQLVSPDEAVVYHVSKYPYTDADWGSQRVARIDITDPTVYVWGVTINSTREEIIAAMEQAGYEIYIDEQYSSITFRLPKENGPEINFNFHSKSIYIRLWIPTFSHKFY